MIQVPHYGLHWIEGDIALLVQRDRVDHILGVQMDFDVKAPIRRRFACPHDIDLSQTSDIELPDDPLVNAMKPVPKEIGERAVFIEDTVDNKTVVQQLLRLSASSNLIPLWMYRAEMLSKHLTITNVAPLVVYGYRTEFQTTLSKMLEASMFTPRRLIIMGPSWTVLRPEAVRTETKVTPADLEGLPLEQIGAGVLRERMMKR